MKLKYLSEIKKILKNNDYEIRTIRKNFDSNYYLKRYPDVSQVKIDPVVHFVKYGWKEFRFPRQDFDTQYYLEMNPDVATSGMNPFFHYLVIGKNEGRSCLPDSVEVIELSEANCWIRDVIKDHFDVQFYLESNKDIAVAGFDPLIHYIEVGWKEGRNPCADFDVKYYLETYPDVAEKGIEPFVHYLAEGKSEGRCGSPLNESVVSDVDKVELSWQKEIVKPYFDNKYYLRKNPDVRDAGIDPLTHFLSCGWKEKRDPSQEFSSDFYLLANPDVAAAGINPLVHYAASGRYEGRQTRHPGGYRAEILRQLKSVDERIEQWSKSRTDNPNSPDSLKEILETAIGKRPNARVVISFSHDDYLENTGGIQACIQEEQVRFSDAGHIYLHMCPDQPMPVLASSDEEKWIGRLIVDGNPCSRFYADDLLGQLAEVLVDRDVIFVVHALHGHRPEWIESLYAAIQPIGAIFWVHDYFSVCLGYNLLRNDISYCAAPDVNSGGCQLCVYGELRGAHQERIRSLFTTVPFSVVAPSGHALSLWEKKGNLPYANMFVHEHRTFDLLERVDCDRSDAPVRVAFLGHSAFHKGWFVFRDLVHRFAGDDRYQFFHLGLSPDPGLDVEYVRVKIAPGEPEVMQRSIRENRIDIALVLSNWPETFCLTAYEAMAGGAMVVTTSLSGNVASMVRDSGHGLVLESDDELMNFFESGTIIDEYEVTRNGQVTYYNLISSGITASLVLDSACNNMGE